MISTGPATDGDAAKSRWSLELFGGFRLSRTGLEPLALSGRRERILLAYLVVEPDHSESRRNLTTLLWGEKADETSLDNLRTCLWSLRKALGDADHQIIVSDRESIGINPDTFDVDVWRFRELLEQDSPAAKEHAVGLYAGDLLDGIEIASIDFEEWLRNTQARFRELAIDALAEIMDFRADVGETNRAIEAGQRIVNLDAFHEGAVRGLMRLYTGSGRRHLALQIYGSLSERLEKDLSIEPEPETQRVFEEIAQGAETSDVDEVPPAEDVAPSSPAPIGPEHFAESVTAPPGVSSTPPGRMAPPARSRVLRYAVWFAGMLGGAAFATLVTIGIVFWRIPELAPAPFGEMLLDIKRGVTATPPSVAVLPFQGHGEHDAEAFADAISEGITSALSIVSDMIVISRSSVRVYKQQPIAPMLAAKALGVRYLLEGAVLKFGDSVSVQVGLIDTAQGERYISVGRYEQKKSDFFALQKEITLKVVTALQVQLTEGEHWRIGLAQGTRNYEAWLLASQGEKQLMHMTPESNKSARGDFEQATTLDPQYVGAWIGLAWTYLLDARFKWSKDREAAIRRAANLAERAYKLNPNRGRTFSLIGTLRLLNGEFAEARRSGERAVELISNDADAAAVLAFILTYTGEPRRATVLARRAIRLRPNPPRWYMWVLARAYRLRERYDEAIEILSEHDPSASKSFVPLVELVAAYGESGAKAKAESVAAKILAVEPQFSVKDWLELPEYSDPNRMERDFKVLIEAGLKE